MIRFFQCKICVEKDNRIEDLKAQVQELRSLVFPKNDLNRIPLVQLEADAIMSGHDEVIQIPPTDLEEREQIQREAEQLLSGTY